MICIGEVRSAVPASRLHGSGDFGNLIFEALGWIQRREAVDSLSYTRDS